MSYNVGNSMTRITGMYSGFDTDQLVSDLMKVETQRVDKYKQKTQYLEWQQEAYREIITSLRDFENKYFSYSNPSTNLRSSSTFNGYKASLSNEDDSRYIEITGGAGSLTGNYNISNISLAKTARAEGSTISTGNIESGSLTPFPTISSANDNNEITVSLNGASKEITIDDGMADINALKTNLQTKIDAEFGNGKITVGVNGDKLTFSTASTTDKVEVDYAYNEGYQLLGSTIGSNKVIDNQNNKFDVTLDGTTKSITLTPNTYATSYDLEDEIQTQIDAAFGAGNIRVVNSSGTLSLKAVDSSKNATSADWKGWDTFVVNDSGNTVDGSNSSFTVTLDGTDYDITLTEKDYTKSELVSAIQSKVDSSKVLVTVDNATGNLRFEALSSKSLSTDKVKNDGLQDLKLDSGSNSNRTDLTANLIDIKDNFSTPLAPGAGDIIEFTINGESFSFDATSTSMNSIIATVNNNQNADVRMMYDELADRIIVESKDTGATSKVEIADVNGNFMQAIGLNGASQSGSDASITIDDGTGPQTIERPSNEFTINGITYDLKEDYAGTVGFKVEGDSDELYDNISAFVEDYNKIIEDINKKLTEDKYYDYDPLTEEQKDEMSEKEIEQWEEKAKSGILRSDSLLRGLVDNMRGIMYESVDGLALYDIGIETSSNYKDGGKLVIDESKLREAIEDDPDQIANLFTKTDEGIANKLYDVLEDNVTTRTNTYGQKGLLLEKAGMVGDRTVSSNIISDQILRYDTMIDDMLDDLVAKENYYYNMFAKMESALAQMQSQSSFLSGQMG
ncbi:flagellar filament capping protein FliD [Wukongibacter baidiensis]|uniref:flagellar filament capping protein FliD n=1 Tax=Wukongibacter baidiensis TaxID=1723361 RepID=UPI003D7F8BA8